MTTAAAGNLAGHSDKDKDKEKVEKRRALGRGLASLLPGPRVLNPFAKTPEPTTGAKAPAEAGADAAVKGLSSTVAPAAEESSSAGVLTGEGRSSTVIPETGSASADRLEATVENPHPSAESGQGRSQSPRVVGHSSPVAESGTVPSSPGEQWSPPFAKDAKDGPPTVIANGSVDYDPYEDAPRDGVIEIQAAAENGEGFDRQKLDQMLSLAAEGCRQIIELQRGRTPGVRPVEPI